MTRTFDGQEEPVVCKPLLRALPPLVINCCARCWVAASATGRNGHRRCATAFTPSNTPKRWITWATVDAVGVGMGVPFTPDWSGMVIKQPVADVGPGTSCGSVLGGVEANTSVYRSPTAA